MDADLFEIYFVFEGTKFENKIWKYKVSFNVKFILYLKIQNLNVKYEGTMFLSIYIDIHLIEFYSKFPVLRKGTCQ